MPADNSRFWAIGADGIIISSITKPGSISCGQIKLGSISNFNILLLICIHFRADRWKITQLHQAANVDTLFKKNPNEKLHHCF